MAQSPHRFRSIALVCMALAAASCSDPTDSIIGTPVSDSTAVDATPPITDVPTTEPAGPSTTVAPDAAPLDPPATDPPATDPPATDPPATDPPAADPAVADGLPLDSGYGDYEVGVQTITLAGTGASARELTVDVWFPLDPLADVEAPLHRYSVLEGTYYESPFALSASPGAIATDGPFPLVVYSHGSGGLRFIHSNYTEALASNGYIVAAADHVGNTAFDPPFESPLDAEISAFNRVNDVARIIDEFTNPQSAVTEPYVRSLRPDQVAVTGHSFGGFTSYAMASGISTDNEEFVADERVEAIITLAPAVGDQLLTDEQLLSIDIPALVIGATNDMTTPIEPNVTRPWNLSASSPSYRVDLTGAEHQTFTDLCAYQAFLPSLPSPEQFIVDTVNATEDAGCGPDDMPIERAQAITNTFAVALLDEVFKGGTPISQEDTVAQTDFTYLVAG